MIPFTEIFCIPHPEKTKVKFNINDADPDIRAYDYLLNGSLNPDWIRMNAHRRVTKGNASNNLDKAEYLLAFAQYYPLGTEYYIFGGMYKVEKILPEVNNGTGYELTLMPDYEDFRNRLIFKLKKPIGRDLYCRKYDSVQPALDPIVYSLLPQNDYGFPGYGKVLLKYTELETIVKNKAAGWIAALKNVKAVYCITDTATGKLYIGSAYGTDGLWGRWSKYGCRATIDGGNQAFRDIVEQQGPQYIVDHFTYAILEIFDSKTRDDEVIQRETHWKKVFDTITHGMNNN